MNYITRNSSLLTGKPNLETLYTLYNFPVFMGCTEQLQREDILADMEWAICRDTGIIQLTKLLPLEVVYLNQHNEGVGKVWTEHYKEFCHFLKKYNPQKVLEIGGAHGLIAKMFLGSSPDTKWTIVEPNPTVDVNLNVKVIKNWFDDKFFLEPEDKVDTIVHSHVLEHTYDPVSFLKHISTFLKIGDKHIFTFPNLYQLLYRKYTNSLNFEHTMFLTEYFVDCLLKKFGFKILEKQYFQDHSIFYATEKISDDEDEEVKIENKYEEYKNVFMNFINYHLEMVKDLNSEIESSKLPIYLFGAHIFSQYLIGFGLKTARVLAVLDNGPSKQGKRLYGTSLNVSPPKILKGKGKVNLILKAGPYNEEIKKDILENINSEVVFW